MRISDGSSDVCSSDLPCCRQGETRLRVARAIGAERFELVAEISGGAADAERAIDAKAGGGAGRRHRAGQPLVEEGLQFVQLRRLDRQAGRHGMTAAIEDRKSTRLTPVTNAQHVCRLLLEKKK